MNQKELQRRASELQALGKRLRNDLGPLAKAVARPLPEAWAPGMLLKKLQSFAPPADAVEVLQNLRSARNRLESTLSDQEVSEEHVGEALSDIIRAGMLELGTGRPLTRWVITHAGSKAPKRINEFTDLLVETGAVLKDISDEGVRTDTHEKERALRRSLSEVVLRLQSYLGAVYNL